MVKLIAMPMMSQKLMRLEKLIFLSSLKEHDIINQSIVV